MKIHQFLATLFLCFFLTKTCSAAEREEPLQILENNPVRPLSLMKEISSPSSRLCTEGITFVLNLTALICPKTSVLLTGANILSITQNLYDSYLNQELSFTRYLFVSLKGQSICKWFSTRSNIGRFSIFEPTIFSILANSIGFAEVWGENSPVSLIDALESFMDQIHPNLAED